MAKILHWGRHRASTDGYLVIVHFIGDFEYEYWPAFRALLEQVITEHGRVYVLGYVAQAAIIAPQARREFIEWLKHHALLGFANIQPSFAARALGLLMSNAFRLMGFVSFKVCFVEDEDSARRWVAECEQTRLRQAQFKKK